MAVVIGAAALTGSASVYRVPDNGDLPTVIGLANADEATEKVVVEANTYELSATLEITGAYRVEGATGKPEDVIIKAANKAVLQPAVKVSNVGATLASVTVSGGAGSGTLGNWMGGNVYNDGGTVTNCCIINCSNAKIACGGGIVNINGHVTGCVITNNCPANGGYGNGVAQSGANAVLDNCLVADNMANSDYRTGGGGIYVSGGAIRHSVIRNNRCYNPLYSSYYDGGGIYVPGSSKVEISDCLIANNVAGRRGGGIRMGSITDCVISNCTIVGNKTAAYEAGLTLSYDNQGNACKVVNTIVWDNYRVAPSSLTPYADEITTGKAVKEFFNLCTKGGYGTNALTCDPQFVDAENGDYRLSPASPCRATGCGWGATMPTSLTVGFSSARRLVKAGEVVIPVFVLAESGAVQYRFRLDVVDGAEGAWSDWGSDAQYTGTLAAGRYVLKVEAKDDAATSAATLTLTVGAETTYLVPAGTAGNTPTPPYDSPETAANTFADALEFAPDGGTLLMADGEYPVTEQQIVRHAVAIKTVNGPDKTSLYRKGKYRTAPSFGVLRLENQSASLEGLTISNGCYLIDIKNHDLGTALWSFGASISNCVFEKNASGDNGYSTGSSAVACLHGTIRDSIVRTNQAGGGYGGGLFLQGDAAMAVDCVVSNNFHTGHTTCSGMGVKMNSGKLIRCQVIDNRLNPGGVSAGDGAGIRVSGASEIRNCLIANNQAGRNGGAIHMDNNIAVKVINCTIADNSAKNGAGISGGNNGPNYAFVNNLFWNNSDSNGSPAAGQPTWYGISASKGTYLNNAVPAEDAKYGATDFVITAPGFEEGGYKLKLASEARDVGNNYDWTEDDIDLALSPRIVKEIVDCGAYEYMASTELTAQYTISGYDTTGAKLQCVATVEGADVYQCRWTYQDLATGLTQDWSDWLSTNVYEMATPPGRYRILLEVTDGKKTIAYDDGGEYKVSSPKVYLVDEAKREGDAAYPYDTWETAANTLAEALTACGNGTTLTVGPGWFGVTEETIISKGVKIHSSEGPDVTSIYAIRQPNEQRRVMTLQHANAELCGFTVSNGYLDVSAGGAGIICRDGSLISNCVVRSNIISYRSGGPLSVLNARALDCIVTDHRDGDDKGSGLYLSGANAYASGVRIYGQKGAGYYLQGCCVVADGALLENSAVISNNLASAQGGSFSGGLRVLGGATVRNCLVAFNRGSSGAALTLSGPATIENCTVVSNSVIFSNIGASLNLSGVQGAGNAYTAYVTNTIFYANTGVGEDAPEVSLGTFCALRLSHTLLKDAATYDEDADACFYADPVFRAFNPATGRYDFRINYASPCLDAGVTREGMLAERDLRGKPRVLGPAVDLGCYECPHDGMMMLVK